MSDLIMSYTPTLRSPAMVVAFAGWPDAGEIATGSVRYIVKELSAQKFAEIEPEEFYDFTQTRPKSATVDGSRIVTWPVNAFYFVRQPNAQRDLLLFMATEPHLKWKTYTRTVAQLAFDLGVSKTISLGGTFDSVPHTGVARVSGSSTNPELRDSLAEMNVSGSGYQGPTSIHSVLAEELNQRGIPSGSLWGHCPHYVQVAPNWKVCHSVLSKLRILLGVDLQLDDLKQAGMALDRQVDQAVAEDPKLKAYVKMLEEQHEVTFYEPPPENLDADEIMRDLEDFFRRQNQSDADTGSTDN